jgi:hypothetical protein
MAHISDIKLIRTDTTLDLSQKAEKGMLWIDNLGLLLYLSAAPLRCASEVVLNQQESSETCLCASLSIFSRSGLVGRLAQLKTIVSSPDASTAQ